MALHHLRLVAPAATIDAADTETRTLAGIALPYGVAGKTSAGTLTIDPGAIRVPEELRRVKLFRDHGRLAPVGFAASATDSPDALRMSFQIARTTDGDQALLEAAEGVRDALSVELDNVEISAGHVTSADLIAVAQVPVPAYPGAVLTASHGHDEALTLTAALSDAQQADVADLAAQITAIADPDPDPEPDDADPDADPFPKDAAMTRPTLEGARQAGMVPAAGTTRNTDRDRQVWAAQAAEAIRGASDAAEVNAALADITPAASTGDVFPRPAWLGELWAPRATRRPLVEAIGVKPLTAMKMEGWKWTKEPEVAPYAGNKADVPTGPATIAPADAIAQRIAGGWDLDRIYVDFSTGFLEAFQAAAVRDYARKSQGYFINGHPDIVGPPPVPAADGILAGATDLGASADLVTAVQAVVTFLTGNGADVSFIAMASDAYRDFFAVKASDAPWWLSQQSSVALGGDVNLAGTAIVVDPSLPAGTVLGGDRDAVSLYETGPLKVNAVNIPSGGIDFGLFGYWAQLVHDDDGLASTTVTQVAGASSRSKAAGK